MKRILSLLLLLAVSLNVWAAVSWSDSQFTYTQIGTTNEVMVKVKSGVTFSGTTVPSTVSYGGKSYSVTEIEDYAFESQSTLTSFTVPSTIRKIGARAFFACTNIETIDLKNALNLKEIGERAFSICFELKELYIPSNVNSIGIAATSGDKELRKITVSRANQYFMAVNNILYNRNQTRLIYVPSSLTGTYEMPATITSIDEYTFQDSQLDKVIFNEGLATIPDNVGYNSCIKELDFPSTMKRIHYLSFSMNYSLTDLYFASATPPIFETASHVDENEFYAIKNRLGNIAMHVPYQDMNTYKNYTPLKGARAYYAYDGEHDKFNEYSYTYNGVRLTYEYSNVNKLSFVAQGQTTTAAEVTVPLYAKYNGSDSKVYGLRRLAFYKLETLKSIVAENIVVIGPQSFEGCTALKDVKLGQAKKLGFMAFRNTGLETYSFQSNVELGDQVFYNCRRLHYFNMFTSTPPTVTGLSLDGVDRNIKIFVASTANYKTAPEWSEFRGYKLKSTTRVLNDSRYFFTINESDKTASFEGFKTYPDDPILSTFVPEYIQYNGTYYTVTSIGSYAFAAAPELNKLDCVTTLKSIGERAFYNTKIKSVTLMSNSDYVPSYGNECINTATDPDDFCFIVRKSMLSKYQTTTGWSGIKQYIKPALVEFTYEGCKFTYDAYPTGGIEAELVSCDPSLQTLTLTDRKTYRIPGNNLPFAITSIADEAFMYSSLKTLKLDLPYLQSIGKSAFARMSQLQTFWLADAGSVQSLPEECFMADTQLKEFYLGQAMNFGTKCCYNCSSLRVLNWDNVKSIGSQAFERSGLMRVKINSSIASVASPAFCDMPNLEILVVEGNTSLSNSDFRSCPKLKDIVCLGSTAPTIRNAATKPFAGTTYNLHVRQGKKSVYSSATGWKSMNITEDADNLQSDNMVCITPVRINSTASAESNIIFKLKTNLYGGWVRCAEFDVELPEGVTVKTTNGMPVHQNVRSEDITVTARMSGNLVHCVFNHGQSSYAPGGLDEPYLQLTVKGTGSTGDKTLHIRNLTLTDLNYHPMEKVADAGSMLYCYPLIWGDMNMDGKFNVADLVTLEGYLNGKQGIRVSPDSKEILSGGDYNSTSLLQMRNKLLGK